jgi:hypothetical protein
VKSALLVSPFEGGGTILFEPGMLADGRGEVLVKFRVAYSGRPVLVDFITSVSSPNAPMGVQLFGSGLDERRSLVQGSHHVTALLIPAEAGWYELSLRIDPTKEYRRLTVEAVEITVLK